MKIEEVLTERNDWKLKFSIVDCDSPKNMKYLRFTGEQYDDGKLINSSSYDFFLNDDEISKLWKCLKE